jgi:NAD-dependent SIR2 family protein deacetylase
MDPYYYIDAARGSKGTKAKIRTKSFYCQEALSNKDSRPHFLSYHTQRRQLARECEATRTHHFIAKLRNRGQLVRNYTQNIDDIERKVGLRTGFGNEKEGVECVQLHGSYRFLRCSCCERRASWDECERETTTLLGQQPVCPWCNDISEARIKNNKRPSNRGALRPDIVLYEEIHLWANQITELKAHDINYGNPDLLLILGTSLRIPGIKVMVKEFARSVHKRGRLVVYVNYTASKAKEWVGVIDYWVHWSCDAWVKDLEGRNSEFPSPNLETKKSLKRNKGIFANERTSLKKRGYPIPGTSSKRRKLYQMDSNNKGNGQNIAIREELILGSTAKCPIDLTQEL